MDTALARSLFWFTALGLTFTLSLAIDRPFLAHPGKLFLTDFRAFYCAGYVHARGYDPYLVEPLRSCEHRVAPDSDLPGDIVVPAPLPGYDLAFFSSLAALPFPTAAALWEISLVLAFIATVVALARLTAIEPEVIFSCLFFSDLLISLSLGQMAPIAIAALSGAMLALSHRQFTIAAILTSISLIEPHLGLGAALALVLIVPQARLPAIACGCVIALISLHAVGVSGTCEYVQTVIPAHVLSEADNEEQYGLIAVLHLFGFTNRTTSVLCGLFSGVFIGIGIVSARALARRTGESAFLIAIPTVFTLIGGPFLHIHQMAAALPAALLSYARLPQRRMLLGGAILMLAVPWTRFSILLLFGFMLMPLTLLLSAHFSKTPLLGQVLISSAILGVVYLANGAFISHPADLSAIRPMQGNALAESVWSSYIDFRFTHNRLLFFLLKLPTWAALYITAMGTSFFLRKDDAQA